MEQKEQITAVENPVDVTNVEEKPKKQKTASAKKETSQPAKKKTVGQKTYKKDYSKFKK